MLQTWIAMANALLKTVLGRASSSGKKSDCNGSQCSWMVVECRFENAEQLVVLTDFDGCCAGLDCWRSKMKCKARVFLE
jgi:hypothetical protein